MLGAENRDAGPVSAMPGGFVIKRRGNGQEVADNRIYAEGDDLRHIDRGATARTGHLYIRRFHEERDRVTLLVADFRPSMLWGMQRAFRSVAAAEALAITGWRAVEAGERVALLALTADGSFAVSPRGRSRGMLAVIGGLARAHEAALAGPSGARADPPLDQALTGISRITPSGAEIVLASGLDTPGDGLADVLGDLSRRRNPRVLMIGDSILGNLPAGQYPMAVGGRRMRARVSGRGATEPRGATLPADIPCITLDAGGSTEAMIRTLGG
ncbi:DUF58 domain-containing protein [Algicella marina]|uniref:DUF58 domain-containing protein n=2 Tax=Algicella marina TaxID=2683284 RepID=A0A6P1T833_9RHOB|nr:DUF58 domain-containing protein [Algicella marina]